MQGVVSWPGLAQELKEHTLLFGVRAVCVGHAGCMRPQAERLCVRMEHARIYMCTCGTHVYIRDQGCRCMW
jgi:hypothetical protein